MKLLPKTIHVDAAVGSRELAPLISGSRHRLKTKVEHLHSADFGFLTHETFMGPEVNPDRQPWRIGIERKTLSDLCGSLLKNRLGGHQIPNMLLDYDLIWIVVEGTWRASDDDMIEVLVGGNRPDDKWGGKWMPARTALTYSALSKWMIRYDVMGRGRIYRWRTSSMTETADYIASLYHWCNKEWAKHKAEAIEKLPPPDKALLWRPNDCERNLVSLDGVGLVNAKRATDYFGSIWEAINGSVQDWERAGLPGAHAARIHKIIRRRFK